MSILKGVRKRYSEYLGVRQIRRMGFWFIDIPRTSSTSIKCELGRRFGAAFGKTNVSDQRFRSRQIFPDHIVASDMRDILGNETWEQIFTFTIVRNPWDRMFSLYHWRRKVGGVPADLTFGDYIRELGRFRITQERTPWFSNPVHYRSGCDFLTDEHGELIVDFVARFEHRDSDLQQAGQRLGFSIVDSPQVQQARPPDADYRSHYDNETREIVAQIYDDDARRFGYAF